MNTKKADSKSLWTKAPVANLVRYEPSGKAKEVRRARVHQKELILPQPDQFIALVNHIRGNGSGKGGPCADAIQFFAYSGPRLNEAKNDGARPGHRNPSR